MGVQYYYGGVGLRFGGLMEVQYKDKVQACERDLVVSGVIIQGSRKGSLWVSPCSGGFYNEKVHDGLRVISLNTNFADNNDL